MGRLGLGALVLGVGLTLAGCKGENQKPVYLNAEPVGREFSLDSIRTDVIDAVSQRGYVVPPNSTWPGIANSNYVGGQGRRFDGEAVDPEKMGRALQDTNLTLGRCGYVTKTIQTDSRPFRTEMDHYWNVPDVVEIKVPALRAWDTLCLPKVLIGPNGEQYFLNPSGLEDSVANRIIEANKKPQSRGSGLSCS